jgi:(2Fe-2S) ferredoxin
MFNIVYNGRIIYKGITEEEVRQIMFELTEQAADGKINLELIELEEI